MSEIKMQAFTREETGKKVKKYRQQGKIPAVLYGRGTDNINLWVDQSEFKKTFREAGENTIIDLVVDKKKSIPVLIHEVQYDNLTGEVSHADFFQVRMDEKIETEVPLELIGEAPAVKEQGGVLVVNINEVPVRCLPSDIPAKFELSLDGLKTFEDRILVGDIKVDRKKVEILMEDDNIIALVSPPRSEAELEALEEKVEEDVSQVSGVEEEKEENQEAAETAKSENQ